MTIDIQNDHDYTIDRAHLRRAARVVMQAHHVDATSTLSIVIETNAAVHALNRAHRDVDAPTDVLSFPADPLPPPIAALEAPHLGDLIIAYPYASAQATRHQHPLDDSLALLVVHGTLHLLGYDHDTAERKAAMWTAQAQILTQLGIDTAIVPTLEGDDHA